MRNIIIDTMFNSLLIIAAVVTVGITGWVMSYDEEDYFAELCSDSAKVKYYGDGAQEFCVKANK